MQAIKDDRVGGFPDDEIMKGGAGGAGVGGSIIGAIGALLEGIAGTKPGLEQKPIGNIKDQEKEESITAPVIPDTANPTPTTPNQDTIVPEITDKTNENIESAINFANLEDIYNQLKADRNEQWAREDAIRAETQAREDNAWQRSIEDARKAGVNVNLMNMTPAESGGGITNASGIDYSTLAAQLNKEGSILEALINNEFKEDENTKDRLNNLISSIISTISMMFVMKKVK